MADEIDDQKEGFWQRTKAVGLSGFKYKMTAVTVMTLIAGLFLIGVALLVHVYCLYPCLLVVVHLTNISGAADTTKTPIQAETPEVALVIAAYNEAEIIADKIENSLELVYPDSKLDIIVFSDASTDGTDDIVRDYAEDGVRLIRIEGRLGKTECQNRVVERIDADIIVFSDADSMYEPDAIDQLVAAFDEDVGCVVGELRYKRYGVEAESAYRRLEKLIKRLEPELSSVVGGNGSIYAVRKSAYVPLPRDHISDFAEPLAIVENGLRVEYAKDAIAWENTNDSVSAEADRRVRISTRSWNTVVDFLSLLNPVDYPLFSFQLASHTVLRWLSPFFLILTAAANIALVYLTNHWFYQSFLFLQTVCYAIALMGALADWLGVELPGPLSVPYYFVRLNVSLLRGFWNFLAGRNIVTWSTETRTTD